VLFITHDLGVVSKICDDVCVIYGGRILESAGVADLFERPQHAYTRHLLSAEPKGNPKNKLPTLSRVTSDRRLLLGPQGRE